MNTIKTLTRYVLYTFLCLCFTNCINYEKKQEPKQTKTLIFETEHCRYYCLASDGWGNCKVVVCECDKGYSGDASVSW